MKTLLIQPRCRFSWGTLQVLFEQNTNSTLGKSAGLKRKGEWLWTKLLEEFYFTIDWLLVNLRLAELLVLYPQSKLLPLVWLLSCNFLSTFSKIGLEREAYKSRFLWFPPRMFDKQFSSFGRMEGGRTNYQAFYPLWYHDNFRTTFQHPLNECFVYEITLLLCLMYCGRFRSLVSKKKT